ncbi:MAG TPA: DUF4349 domain-containing protein [Panacibacter sp.]|nr:DUF4349 domain-containing protein [Panacibacter sp.]
MKFNILFAAIIAVLATLCISACDNQKEKMAQDLAVVDIKSATQNAPSKSNQETEYKSQGVLSDVATTDTSSSSVSQSTDILQSGSPAANPDWDKKIIKTAHVTLELKDYTSYNNGIHTKLKAYGAYVAQEQQNQTDEQISNDISIKVPVDKFDDLMNSLSGDGIKVLEKNISTEDVTGEVVDTKARMEAKKQVRDRYLDLLKQAHSMKDILEVQGEINAIQEDIESAAGRVDYLVHASAYSTVNIKYFQYLNGITKKDTEPTFFSELSEAFKDGASVISNLLLFIISIWPLLIAAVLLTLYFKRWKVKKV